MGLIAHSLASGSSGNCILIRNDKNAVLIDAGIGIRRIVSGLADAKTLPEDISAILITHEHSDHISGAIRMSRKYGIPLVANESTLRATVGAESGINCRVMDVGEEICFGSISARSFPVSHDARNPVGYTLECSGKTVCSATDTGLVTPQIKDEISRADLLILESNYDSSMLMTGPYPWFLKKRIAGERGHLSNEMAANTILDVADGRKELCVWLAHLSKNNNTPGRALKTVRSTISEKECPFVTISVAMRDFPSLWWGQDGKELQPTLF